MVSESMSSITLNEKPPREWRKRSGVYVIHCDSNDRYYVGGTGDLGARFTGHRASLRHDRHKNPHLSMAYKKYGERAFSFRPLEYCEPVMVIERESEWLSRLSETGALFNIRMDAAGRPAQPSDALILKSRALHSRKNLIKFSFIDPDGIVFSGSNLAKFCREKSLLAANMWQLLNGVAVTHKGWRLQGGRSRRTNADAIGHGFSFKSPSGEIHSGKNIRAFAKEMNLTGTSLHLVATGNQKHHKGWTKA